MEQFLEEITNRSRLKQMQRTVGSFLVGKTRVIAGVEGARNHAAKRRVRRTDVTSRMVASQNRVAGRYLRIELITIFIAACSYR